MGQYIMVIGKIIKLLDMGFILGQMGGNLRVIGKITL
jgi:hypothetical protein